VLREKSLVGRATSEKSRTLFCLATGQAPELKRLRRCEARSTFHDLATAIETMDDLLKSWRDFF
jgi:hypothetical protein